jgi:hypothetical protein
MAFGLAPDVDAEEPRRPQLGVALRAAERHEGRDPCPAGGARRDHPAAAVGADVRHRAGVSVHEAAAPSALETEPAPVAELAAALMGHTPILAHPARALAGGAFLDQYGDRTASVDRHIGDPAAVEAFWA